VSDASLDDHLGLLWNAFSRQWGWKDWLYLILVEIKVSKVSCGFQRAQMVRPISRYAVDRSCPGSRKGEAGGKAGQEKTKGEITEGDGWWDVRGKPEKEKAFGGKGAVSFLLILCIN
jgi:hypothetical protein